MTVLRLSDRPTLEIHFGGRWTPELLIGKPIYERMASVGPVLGHVVEARGEYGNVQALIALTPEGESAGLLDKYRAEGVG